MARYNVLGTVILGSLSSFGSVMTAWGYFPLSCSKNRHLNFPRVALPTSITNPTKSRKTPTQVEVDRVEQSLIRIRTDLVSKWEELTSLKRREASQTEVICSESDCYVPPDSVFRPLLRNHPGLAVLHQIFVVTMVCLVFFSTAHS